MGAPLSDFEKSRVRHHLGYPNVEAVSTFYLGVPAAMQTTFMIEGAMVRVLPEAVDLVRTLMARMDSIENQVFCGSDLADVEELGEIKVAADRVAKLAEYYKLAQHELSNLFGVVPNPWDQRSWLQYGAVNVPVVT